MGTIGDSISLEEWAQLGDVNLAIEMDALWRYDALRTLARSDSVHHRQAYARLCKVGASARMSIFKDVEAWVCWNASRYKRRYDTERALLMHMACITLEDESGRGPGPEATARNDTTSGNKARQKQSTQQFHRVHK